MKKTLLVNALLLLLPFWLMSQSTERFIRIVGNANYEFEADAAKLEYTLSEILENGKKQIEPLSFDEVYSQFIRQMDSLGIESKYFERTDVNLGKYVKSISKTFELYLDSVDDIDKLTSMKSKGVRLKSIRYVYNNIDPAIQENLMMLAIEDAKRKANNICKELEMKLGKVLNIEDSSSGCCGDIKDSKESKTKKKYGLYITFQLND